MEWVKRGFFFSMGLSIYVLLLKLVLIIGLAIANLFLSINVT